MMESEFPFIVLSNDIIVAFHGLKQEKNVRKFLGETGWPHSSGENAVSDNQCKYQSGPAQERDGVLT